jgi:predicted DNA-binding protein
MKGKSITFRPTADMRERLDKLAGSKEWTLTQIVEKCIEGHLPVLEQKYEKEIREFESREKKEEGARELRRKVKVL